MIKMIEKNSIRICTILSRGKGRLYSFYWHHFSKLYSYDLKEGYHVGDYPILDAVLNDFDVSYRIENESSLKYYNLSELRKKISLLANVGHICKMV